MGRAIVRLQSIALDGFKNVSHGSAEIENAEDSSAGILALYGQNGSGKTALIESVDLLKHCLTDQKLGKRFGTYIAYGADSARAEYRFCISNSRITSRVVYQVTIAVRVDGADGISDERGDSASVYISREVLKVSVGEASRLRTVIDTGEGEAFGPKTMLKNIVGESRSHLLDLAVAKRVAQRESRSFIFSQEFLRFCSDKLRAGSPNATADNSNLTPAYLRLIQMLAFYGRDGLFVVDTSSADAIGLGALSIFFRTEEDNGRRMSGMVLVPMDGPTNISESQLHVIEKVISSLNIVLKQLVPGLEMAVRDYGKVTLDDGSEGRRIQLLSKRGEIRLPFGCESEGVRKIASILQILTLMYNEPSVLVAIDELDSGIFEYLLGELLHIVSEGGKGQLIFTSHNLRPLETLDRHFIAFTSTDPKNRYVRMRGIKNSNNLRSLYFRSIMLGDSAAELYSPTSDAEIAYALRQAGDGNAQESGVRDC